MPLNCEKFHSAKRSCVCVCLRACLVFLGSALALAREVSRRAGAVRQAWAMSAYIPPPVCHRCKGSWALLLFGLVAGTSKHRTCSFIRLQGRG